MKSSPTTSLPLVRSAPIATPASSLPTPSVACFGEILWDSLPDGLFPGGAPFNVAYHLQHHGVTPHVISAVGRDVLGDELLRRMAGWSLPVGTVTRHTQMPTGFVRAHVGDHGDARYEIVTGVAWDEIPATEAAARAMSEARAFVFGSLAQRTPQNRATFVRLLAALPRTALRVFDVNLRPPFDDLGRVRQLAAHATLLKLNAAEAARLAGEPSNDGREESYAAKLAADTGCTCIVITCGARGAGLWRDGKWHWERGQPVAVADTIGSGDAFLASLIAYLLSGAHTDADCLARACRLGEWVATQRGATPAYSGHQQIPARR